jgi:hypothetical protein
VALAAIWYHERSGGFRAFVVREAGGYDGRMFSGRRLRTLSVESLGDSPDPQWIAGSSFLGGMYVVYGTSVAYVVPATADGTVSTVIHRDIADVGMGSSARFTTTACGITNDDELVVLAATDCGSDGGRRSHGLALVWFSAGGMREFRHVVLAVPDAHRAIVVEWPQCFRRLVAMPDGAVVVYIALGPMPGRATRHLLVYTARWREGTCELAVSSAVLDAPPVLGMRTHFEVAASPTGCLLASWTWWEDMTDDDLCIRRLPLH